MTKFLLQPWDEKLESEGKVTYHEQLHAWNTIRLKKVFLDQFPILRDRKVQINFRLEYYKDTEKLIQSLKDKIKQGEGTPFLLYLYKE